MAAEPVLATLDVSVVQRRRATDSGILHDYWALTKPEVNFLIVVTTFAGFYLAGAAQSRDFPLLLSINTIVGTLLVASGAGTLNQYIERTHDAEMRRTSRRPLAAGRLTPSSVLAFGVTLSAGGSIYLAAAVNGLASALAVFTLLSYLFVYTPLKRTTPLCTLVGAVPGAVPPLIGWAAASGKLTWQALPLFAVLFLWQFPHFMAIAWMYRDDYDRAGYRVLPRGRARSPFAGLQVVLPLLMLLALSTVPTLAGRANVFCGAGALAMGLGFLYYGAKFASQKSSSSARRLLAASIVYLPSLFALSMLIGR
jgi:heme o synthase